jgi:hypothetical protein
VLVELDRQLRIQLLRVKTCSLLEYFADLLRRHAMIDDEVEADLGQRKPKLFCGAVNSTGSAGQVWPEIYDWNHFCVGHNRHSWQSSVPTIAAQKRRGPAPLHGKSRIGVSMRRRPWRGHSGLDDGLSRSGPAL